jgi:two-component system chemotaxis response regulator CheB
MKFERPVRVLIVDDSAFARKVMREVLAKAPEIEIVGIARDGLDALEQCESARPDVIALDLMMPELDGLGVLRALAERPFPPRVVLVSSSALESRIAVEALALGAFSLVQKPTALATDRLYEVGAQLVSELHLAASSLLRAPAPPPSAEPAEPRASGAIEVLVVGTSTGGPRALNRLLSALPGDLLVPVAAVVHIPEGYTASLAERIDRASELQVLEAADGLEIGSGMAVIARAGLHLTLVRTGHRRARCVLSSQPVGLLHRPAVDVLFTSAAKEFGGGVLAAVLTGMGDDGLLGSRAIRAAGGIVLTEHASSCVVDGMPRAVVLAGLSNAEFTLESMASALVARV